MTGDPEPLDGRHPVDVFWSQVEAIPHADYPERLAPIAGRYVDGVAGFPAGRGLYAPCGWDHTIPPPFPYGGLMLVGHHLDAEDLYVEKLAAGHANGDPCPETPTMRFWSMLYATLDEAGIDRSRIFVTNVHPALIRGSDPRGSVTPTRAWTQHCRRMLTDQIRVMRPAAVAAMGTPAQRFLADLLDVDLGRAPSIARPDEGPPIIAMRHPSAAQSLALRSRTAELLGEATS